MELTQEEKATNFETMLHIQQVQTLLLRCCAELHDRCMSHDQSKLGPPEVNTFVEFTPKLRGSTYGSDEYNGFLAAMKPALDNHYANNRHHPEHFEKGMLGMNLIDLLEMLCDWFAATKRHADGDLYKSIDLNAKRFGYSDELRQIFVNTADYLTGKSEANDAAAD